ncbi:MAG: peptidoglycan DD-metalloendopeptidase family protein [Thermoanaerobaculia bacterium]
MSPWQEYRDALQAGDLGRTSAVRAWLAAGGRAVAAAPAIAAPYREIVYFDPLQPTAGAWRLALNEREELRVQVAGPANGTARLFLDLLRWERREWRSVATLQQGSKLRYRVGEAGTHVLRIQPELPSGGRWTVTVVAGPRLIFPVEGADSGAIGGRFGDSRDDGRRSHEGVDIFAPRGTRALAAADGWVSRINRTRLGGRVAWVETDDGLRLYYAHLKSWKVRAGERVRAGDVIGRVGSTGNAKRRSPHLHFGVYDDGPVDPLAFLLQPAGRPAEVTSDLALLGGWARVGADHVSLHAGPSAGSPVRGGAFRHEALHVDGATADWYRVRTADGPVYVASRLLEGTDTPIRRLLLESRRALRREPAPAAPIVAEVEAHASLEVLAEREEYLLVRRAAGERPAWLAIR